MTDFEAVYETYFHQVYGYVRQLSGNAHVAEEITSETFFKAMEAIDSFRGDCDVRVWLCQIAKNCYYSYRKKKRPTSLFDETLPDPAPSPEAGSIRRDQADRARVLLHSLSEPYKEVFLWRVYGELSFRDIGQLFQKSENWACVTYHRARKKLLEQLEGELDEA